MYKITLKIIAVLSIFFIPNISLAQDKESDIPTSIIAEFGLNKHGTGDQTGFLYGLRVHKPISKRFEIIASFEANLNDSGDTPFIGEDLNGNSFDGTLHNVLAGFQLNAGIGFNLINSDRSKFGINPSVFGRYQANSALSTNIDYPIITGYPVPIRSLIREEPGRTYAVGGSIRLYYHYKISDKLLLGISPGFQTDSQDDTMLFTTLMLGLNL